MESLKGTESCQYEVTEGDDGGIMLRIQGRMDSSSASQMIEVFGSLLNDRRPLSLRVDLEKVTYFDDFGTLVLVELRDIMNKAKGRLDVINAREDVLFVLDSESPEDKTVSIAIEQPPGMFIRFGEAIIQYAADIKYLVSFIGSVILSFVHVCFYPKALRMNDTLIYMQKAGVDAIPIVSLISFLLGLIMAFMSSAQLQQFGANIYVASLVAMAMTRELGPIMTAVIVAGRTSSSFAAEIGTMKIAEEVDALFTMGFDPTQYLAVPRILACMIVVPILTLFSDLFAMLGALFVGVFMLDLTANAFITQTIRTLTLFEVFFGVFKSGIFAVLISWIACLRGFRVTGGAASVGQATTSAVVSSIFLIIASDTIFTIVIRYCT